MSPLLGWITSGLAVVALMLLTIYLIMKKKIRQAQKINQHIQTGDMVMGSRDEHEQLGAISAPSGGHLGDGLVHNCTL